MSAYLDLILEQAGVRYIPTLEATEGLSQEYGWVESAAVNRNLDGVATKRTNWCKRSTTLSGGGWTTDPFEGLDWRLPILVHCVHPIGLTAAAAAIELPALRRLDTPLRGFGVVNNLLVPTVASMAGDVMVLQEVPGADRYRALYWPRLTCYAITPPRRALNVQTAQYGWVLEMEEV